MRCINRFRNVEAPRNVESRGRKDENIENCLDINYYFQKRLCMRIYDLFRLKTWSPPNPIKLAEKKGPGYQRERRRKILDNWKFNCFCERCRNETEIAARNLTEAGQNFPQNIDTRAWRKQVIAPFGMARCKVHKVESDFELGLKWFTAK